MDFSAALLKKRSGGRITVKMKCDKNRDHKSKSGYEQMTAQADGRKEKYMGSKGREAKEGQKAYWENKLNQRLSYLTEKGLEPTKIAKDAAVRRIRAQIRKTEGRLGVITGLEKKTAEMARIKAEKISSSEKEKSKKSKEPEKATEMSKRQQKKRKKRESKSEG